MALRTVRLDTDAEAALREIREATGLPISEALKRGLHALQDAFAHRGENMNKHLFNITIWDIVGSTNGARSITKSALIVYEILHGSFSNVTEGTVLDFGGMTPGQIARVERELDRKGYYIDWQ